MRYFALGLLASLIFAVPEPSAAKSNAKGLTPEQAARCAQAADRHLRNTRMPGTRKLPRFCRQA
jgi:hypothetical protein